MVGFTGAFFQTIKVTAASNNHLQAVRQVQNAGLWINRDGQKVQPQGVNFVNNVLTLTCKDSPIAVPYNIVYTWSDTQLTLTRLYNGVNLIIAQDITAFSPTGSDLTGYSVTITAKFGGFQPGSERLTYFFKPRPTG